MDGGRRRRRLTETTRRPRRRRLERTSPSHTPTGSADFLSKAFGLFSGFSTSGRPSPPRRRLVRWLGLPGFRPVAVRRRLVTASCAGWVRQGFGRWAPVAASSPASRVRWRSHAFAQWVSAAARRRFVYWLRQDRNGDGNEGYEDQQRFQSIFHRTRCRGVAAGVVHLRQTSPAQQRPLSVLGHFGRANGWRCQIFARSARSRDSTFSPGGCPSRLAAASCIGWRFLMGPLSTTATISRRPRRRRRWRTPLLPPPPPPPTYGSGGGKSAHQKRSSVSWTRWAS